jgi:hypothetical protein
VRDDGSTGAALHDVVVDLVGPEQSTATCTVYSVAADGNALQSASLSATQAGAVRLEFGPKLASFTSSGSDTTYSLYCTFGDGNQFWVIKGYRVVESQAND